MTKQEYMQKLQEKLESFGKELQEEILEDYRQHFAEGEKQGKADEEIIEELGNIEDMIRDLSEVDFPEGFGNRAAEGVLGLGSPVETAQGEARNGLQSESQSGAQGEGPNGRAQETETKKSYAYPGNYREMVLESKMANIYVERSEDDQIHVDYEAKGLNSQMNYEYYQYEKEGVFYAGVVRRRDVREDGESDEKMVKVTLFGRTIISYGNVNIFTNEGQNVNLYVRVPSEMPRLTAKVASGNIRITQLALESLDASSASGNVKIFEAKSDQMKARAGSGNITVGSSRFLEGSFDTGSGNVKVEGSRGEEMKCVTGSGNVKVEESEMEEYRLSTGSGNIKANVKAAKKVKMSTGSGSVKLKLEQADGMEASIGNGSGSAHITWKGEERKKVKNGTYIYGDGACKVKASTGSGSIDICVGC